MHVCLTLHAHLDLGFGDSTEIITAQLGSQEYSTPQERLLSAEIDELNGIKDVTQLCLFYIDLQGEVQRLQVCLQDTMEHTISPAAHPRPVSGMRRQLLTR